ncbi:MAG: UDP-N-acetylmuramoyl-tripeptide--D-alanyl-D-alanine ligase [Candidatus Peregrinibacteria bacterium]|nr:UDP-N-acetylmuramoyl-tripeptide--D-alanyl-D-alanine ligase [Candidatus Peregrinibacteria bacterium]
MKNLFKKIVLLILKRLAIDRMKKFTGKVVAVTGSAGKTSTKDAVFAVLNTQFKVKRNEKSMNSEFGLLLTILDIPSGYSSALTWSWLLLKAAFNSLFKDHSEILLLEYGVDKLGDMDFLTFVAKPDVAIMTNIYPVHLDEGQFENVEEIFQEKSKIANALKDGGKLILNIDNSLLYDFAKSWGKKGVITFGKNEESDYLVSSAKTSLDGVNFMITHHDIKMQVSAPIVGGYQFYVLTPAIICADIFGIPLQNALNTLTKFRLPPGRMNIIEGIEGSTILDGSYNASPEVVKEALKTLKDVAREADTGREKGEKPHRRVAVLGNMNELGSDSKTLHELVGAEVKDSADILITVGGNARLVGEIALGKGMDEKSVFYFDTALDAAEFFKKKIEEGDIILVKGSQNNVRLERFVKEIMAHPEDAKKLLVRQEKVWENL